MKLTIEEIIVDICRLFQTFSSDVLLFEQVPLETLAACQDILKFLCKERTTHSFWWQTIPQFCHMLLLEAEGKGTKASEGKCGHVKRGVVGRVQSCLGTPSTLCLSSTFKR